ncbi:MAG TPA: rhomboid family intramembrane serine protease [Bacteroidia bacterium]|nr:rhomboid family intramembrane serine protease [Bacteroidia bacterium]HNT80137.1 rhomboid family intramembrane serine protease [Bacteroidia bacterium]
MNQSYRPSSFKLLPDVVKNLLIINGIMFLLDYVLSKKLGLNLGYTLGLFVPTSTYFEPYQLVTHLFMHGSFLHIFSNMLALWMFGNSLENIWGPKKFLIYYFITGLGAASIHLAVSSYELRQEHKIIEMYAASPSIEDFEALVKKYNRYADQELADVTNTFYYEWSMDEDNPVLVKKSIEVLELFYKQKTDIPTVGASGAVFGVLLAFGMLFPNAIIYLYFAIPVKAKYFVFFYGAFELYLGIQNNPGDNIAHFAHLGGMLFGFLLIKLWNKRRFDHFRDY